MTSFYNYILNLSNTEDDEDEYQRKHIQNRKDWNNITNYFLSIGSIIQFKYWKDDILKTNQGYPSSGYGIDILTTLNHESFIDKEDGLNIISVRICDKVLDLFNKSYNKDIETITPFFHFVILDKSNVPIYTSQDFGDNVLFYLTEKDKNKLINYVNLFDEIILLQD
ncbi:hypothetical protein MHH96_20905 [Niallia sp. FSL K6-0212]|uniref:hypothetical protein n=1 Tax=Niallia sp. FSL K6-0212 TaxID=2921423 RepID=UPI0030FC538C